MRSRPAEPAALPPRTLLIDYGGVLTTSVFDAFAAFCVAAGLPPDALRRCLREDAEASRLLVAVERGELPALEFEHGLAARLATFSGLPVDGDRLIERMTAALEPESLMIEATAALRGLGVTTVLVSNSHGDGGYGLCELSRLFDHVVVSGRVGARKPSRAIYRLALEAAVTPAEACVMVDDLEQNLAGAARLGIRTVHHRNAAATVAALEQAFEVSLDTGVVR